MEDTYVLNPDEEEIFLYGIDVDGSNLPLQLSKGPYYESLEAIPIIGILMEREQIRRQKEYELAQEQSQITEFRVQPSQQFSSTTLNYSPPRLRSPEMLRSRSPSPRRFIDAPSPELLRNKLLPSPSRMEFGLTPEQTKLPDPIFIRKWKVIQAIEVSAQYNGYPEPETFCENVIKNLEYTDGALTFRTESGELYLCSPAQVLEEYVGLFKISKPFGTIKPKTSKTNPAMLELYSGGRLVGTFEEPLGIVSLPGRFNSLPGEIQMKIAANLETDDLIKFCNINANNRRLCQDPKRSVWVTKLLQLNPNVPIARIKDPFHYFLQYHYGGKVLTLGYNGDAGIRGPLGRNLPEGKDADLDPRPMFQDSNSQIDTRTTAYIASSENGSIGITPFGYVYATGIHSNFMPGQSIENALSGSCGRSHFAILHKDGRVSTYGDNTYFQLGRGEKVVDRNASPPMINPNDHFVPTITSAVAVACGYEHTVILLSNGKIVTFGHNNEGQLGRETVPIEIKSRWGNGSTLVSADFNSVIVEGIENALQIAAGAYHTIVVLRDGRVMSFGMNKSLQLGRETSKDGEGYYASYKSDTTPREIPIFRTAVNVACGLNFTAVLLNDGRVATFGNNDYRKLGRSTDDLVGVVPNVDTAVHVSCGTEFMLITLKNGKVLQYGYIYRNSHSSSTRYRETDKPRVLPGVNTAIMTAAGGELAAILVINRGW